jgi:hypothetical protein
MPNKQKPVERRVLAKDQALEAGGQLRGRIEGDRTIFDLGADAQKYKLSDAYSSVRNLEFRSDTETAVQTFGEYLDTSRELVGLPFKVKRPRRPRYPADEAYRNKKWPHLYREGDLLVLVDSRVYDAVAASIDQYVLDVGRDGFWATIHVVQGGTPEDIRGYIRRRRPVGVLMVGAIRAAWFDLGGAFPCDLYYMDTNGTWTDPDGDGKFNDHSGNLDPEIWVGRLYTPTAGGNDASLINDYFARNHAFRVGKLGHERSALAFVDDDWTGFEDCAFDQMFPHALITVYTTPTETDADLYKAQINTLRSWAQLCAHSWVQGHALKVGSTNEYIPVGYFRDTNPPNAHFYNLFCCGPGRFTSANYLAGWYIFDKQGGGTNLGLTAVASAKTGSMLFFEDFYRPLGQGKSIGEAFVRWWQARGPQHDDSQRSWFYGLALLGDPTLTWWKGAVPQPEQPQEGDVFDQYPRKMQFRWDPVNISGAKYTVEVDAFGAVNAGKWAEATNQSFAVYPNVTGITLDHTFVGAQRGRWRVRAEIDGQVCSWSPWSYFRYTV